MTEHTATLLDGFLVALSKAGIEVTALRRIDFLRAITLVQLIAVDDLYWAARITLVSNADQIAIFDAVFAAWFNAGEEAAGEPVEGEEEIDGASSVNGSDQSPPSPPEQGEGTGRFASNDELLYRRQVPATDETRLAICSQITAAVVRNQARKHSRRYVRDIRSGSLDFRRTLASMLRSGGELSNLSYRQRPKRPRRTIMLIDVSGSLKATSADALRAAHAFRRAISQIEVFTFGTRLTRVTKALGCRDVDEALAQLSTAIFDFDGGTRIGDSFQAFLDDSHLGTLARGAVVIVVSDGLERGDVGMMARTTERLGLLAHRLVWLTPLLGDPHYRPVTRGMQAILGSIDRLGDASSLTAFLREASEFDRLVEKRPRRSVRITS